jgi:hypothetical protein
MAGRLYKVQIVPAAPVASQLVPNGVRGDHEPAGRGSVARFPQRDFAGLCPLLGLGRVPRRASKHSALHVAKVRKRGETGWSQHWNRSRPCS